MTYLELVNEVLARLRQDEIPAIIGEDDEAAKMVIKLVNDAKTKVENAWDWNALRYDWDLVMTPSQAEYVLTDSSTYVKIMEVSNDTKGYFMRQASTSDIKRKSFGNSPNGFSDRFSVDGANTSRDVTIKFWPSPANADSVTVTGWKNQPRLELDDDVLIVPELPVIYEALAMAARERGEVGGQTALEIFGMAKKYLEDAVALDAALSPLDTVWYQV